MAGPAASPTSSTGSVLLPGVPPLPEGATPEQIDLHWFRHVYQADRMPQLTFRSVAMGGVLGMLMAASNLYTTLAIGWSFGVAITACVMSFVIWNAFVRLSGGRVSRMSILENNCMQSTASAAGYSTGSTIATMFGALLLYQAIPEGQTAADLKSWSISPIWAVALFTLCTGLMGVFLAIPLKRQMINHEQLRFPSGTAAAETLSSLYSESADAARKAYVLIVGIVAGVLVGFLNTAEGTLKVIDTVFEKIAHAAFDVRLPEMVPAAGLMKVHGTSPQAFGFEPSVLLIAAGIITRMRVSLSMFAGSVLLYFVVGPWLVEMDTYMPGSGWVRMTHSQIVYDPAAYVAGTVRNIDLNAAGTALRLTTWSLWGGTAVMVMASLTAIALQWRTIVRAFTGLKREQAIEAGQDRAGSDELRRAAAIEVPTSWMVAGMIPVAIAMLFVQVVAFNISWWAGLIAIALSFFLSLVACRATGETDTTPIGAMGKVMQLLFAALHPGQVVPNLASAGIAANSAASSADLLTDLKSGYLLGANPRKQFIAQFVGVFFGTLVIVPVWFLMVPDRATLDKFAAPSTRQWEAVARVLTKGIDYLPDSAKWAILVGAAVGVVLPLLERLLPPKLKPYVPSAMGLGLSWVIPFSSAIGFFLGALLGWLWELFHRPSAEKYAIALASGLIAGESLTKAFIAMAATVVGLMGK